MTTKLLDSVSRVDPASAKAAGYSGILRYLNNGVNGSSCLNHAEVTTYTAAGFGVGSLWEKAPDAAAHGQAQGAADAKAAVASAKALGQPLHTAIYFAVDEDPVGLPGGIPTVVDYFRGVAPVLRAAGYLVGAYAGAAAANACLDARVIDRVFIPAASSWNDGAVPKRLDLQQGGYVTIGGAQYDGDTAADLATVGLWNGAGHFPKAPPTPAPKPAPSPVVRSIDVRMPLVSKDSSPDVIRCLQRILNGNGHTLKVDGVWGKATDAAVRAFQKAHGITPASHFGPESWHAAAYGQK